MKLKVNVWYIPVLAIGFFIIYLIGSILYFNATPLDKRLTVAVEVSSNVHEAGFKQQRKSCIFKHDLENATRYTQEMLEDRSNREKFIGLVTRILAPHL